MGSNISNGEASDHECPSHAPESSMQRLKKAEQEQQGRLANPAPSPTPLESIEITTPCGDGLGAHNKGFPSDHSQQVTKTAGPAIADPQSLISSRHAHAVTRDILNTTIREAESNLRTRAHHQAKADPQDYVVKAIFDDDDASVSRASSTASPQPPVLYDYQVDPIAKGLAAGKKNKEKQEKLNIQALGWTTPSAPSCPVSGPPPPPERSMRRAPSARSGPTPPTKKETLGEIRHNMDKLLADDPICDRAFAAMHYGGGARPLVRNQRVDFSAHSRSMGENLSCYANTGPGIGEKSKLAERNSDAEEAAVKSVKEIHKANRDYYEVFERTLCENFD